MLHGCQPPTTTCRSRQSASSQQAHGRVSRSLGAGNTTYPGAVLLLEKVASTILCTAIYSSGAWSPEYLNWTGFTHKPIQICTQLFKQSKSITLTGVYNNNKTTIIHILQLGLGARVLRVPEHINLALVECSGIYSGIKWQNG